MNSSQINVVHGTWLCLLENNLETRDLKAKTNELYYFQLKLYQPKWTVLFRLHYLWIPHNFIPTHSMSVIHKIKYHIDTRYSGPPSQPSAPATRSYRELWIHSERDAANVDVLSSLMQDAPQLILQLYIMTHTIPEQNFQGEISQTCESSKFVSYAYRV